MHDASLWAFGWLRATAAFTHVWRAVSFVQRSLEEHDFNRVCALAKPQKEVTKLLMAARYTERLVDNALKHKLMHWFNSDQAERTAFQLRNSFTLASSLPNPIRAALLKTALNGWCCGSRFGDSSKLCPLCRGHRDSLAHFAMCKVAQAVWKLWLHDDLLTFDELLAASSQPYGDEEHPRITPDEDKIEHLQQRFLVVYLLFKAHNEARHMAAFRSVPFWIRYVHAVHVELTTRYKGVGPPPHREDRMITIYYDEMSA